MFEQAKVDRLFLRKDGPADCIFLFDVDPTYKIVLCEHGQQQGFRMLATQQRQRTRE